MVKRFGSYELLDKIAVGGMAEIFRARVAHGKGVRKEIVIKRIHPALSADPSFVAMFIDEARLGVSLVHGNIVPVFDFGYIDGYYYLAMEHVEGRDLAVLCGRAKVVGKPWPWPLALYIISEVLEGLDYAHNKRDEQGRRLELVHRDVSPANILISFDGQVKLLDFGIARSLAREYETRTGVVKGKPGYMAPEQAAGKHVDARADIWSCGAVLHELLTGQKLKDGRLRFGDAELDALLDNALKVEPSRRFADAASFQEALGEVLVRRGKRPTSAQLGRFVREVSTSAAKGENWDMMSDHVEQHLAAALAPRSERQSSSPSADMKAEKKEPERGGVGEEKVAGTGITRRLSTETAAVRWIRPAAALAVFVAALAVGWAVWPSAGREGPVVTASETAPETFESSPREAPSRAALTIVASPEDAAVRLDGRPISPGARENLELEPGEHRVEVTREGYRVWRSGVVLEPGQTRRLEIVLEPLQGRLSVVSAPEEAQVLVDGVEQGVTPLESLAVTPGTHRVRVARKGYTSEDREVEVEAGAEQRVEVTLEKKRPVAPAPAQRKEKAVLSVNTTPWSNVVLDGRPIGNTPVLGRQISPGRHVLILTNPVRNLTKKLVFFVGPGGHKRVMESLRE